MDLFVSCVVWASPFTTHLARPFGAPGRRVEPGRLGRRVLQQGLQVGVQGLKAVVEDGQVGGDGGGHQQHSPHSVRH